MRTRFLHQFHKIELRNGLYYKPNTIVIDDSSIIDKLEPSLIDDAGVVIYDRHMYIVHSASVYNVSFF